MSDIQKYWNRNWTEWDADVKPSDFAVKAYKLMKMKDIRSVLDLGSGTGRDCMFFAAQGIKVTALDISEAALAKINHPLIQTMQGDISTVELGKEVYEAVFANLSLHYFDDGMTRKIITRIYEALNPEGVFFIKCRSEKDRFFGQGEQIAPYMFKDEHLRHFFTKEYMTEVLFVFDNFAVMESEEDYYGPSAFVEAVCFKNE